MRIAFEKESKHTIKAEYDRVNKEINDLLPTVISVESGDLTINHKVFLTMVDGKTINVLENNTASSVNKTNHLLNCLRIK